MLSCFREPISLPKRLDLTVWSCEVVFRPLYHIQFTKPDVCTVKLSNWCQISSLEALIQSYLERHFQWFTAGRWIGWHWISVGNFALTVGKPPLARHLTFVPSSPKAAKISSSALSTTPGRGRHGTWFRSTSASARRGSARPVHCGLCSPAGTCPHLQVPWVRFPSSA